MNEDYKQNVSDEVREIIRINKSAPLLVITIDSDTSLEEAYSRYLGE